MVTLLTGSRCEQAVSALRGTYKLRAQQASDKPSQAEPYELLGNEGWYELMEHHRSVATTR